MPTVLYGIGIRTKEYIERHPEEDICAILDGFRTDGEFCGIPVISLDALAGKHVRIVILARKASEKIIYDRIKGFCIMHGIPVYGMDLERIEGERKKADPAHPYFLRNREELWELIEKYEAVSFDIFDTLLIREVGDVRNVYRMAAGAKQGSLGFDFVEERVRAELELAGEVPTLRDIYGRISQNTGTPEDVLEEILCAEIEVEKSVLRPRAEVLWVYRRALESGKRVFLISDMYLEKDIITGILLEKGIFGYEKLYLSCEYGVDKAGGLYGVYKEEAGIDSGLHVGDDQEKDGVYAGEYGLFPYILFSPATMAEISYAGDICRDTSGMAQSISLSRLFENPFALFRSMAKIRVGSPYEIGYCLLAPALYQFCLWLSEKAKRQGISDIFFAARDGYVMKRVFDMMTEGDFRTEYLPVSRTLVMMAYPGAEDQEDTVERIARISRLSFDGAPQDMLVKRFGLEKESLTIQDTDMSEQEYIRIHTPLILDKAGSVRKNYRKFLQRYGIHENAAFVDFVSAGTCQAGLEDILGVKLKGFYFEKADGLWNVDAVGFTGETGGRSCTNYFLIEPLIKEGCPSIREIDGAGNIVYCGGGMSAQDMETATEVRRGVLDYAAHIREKGYIKSFSRKQAGSALELLALFDREYIDMQGFGPAENFDVFSNRRIRT